MLFKREDHEMSWERAHCLWKAALAAIASKAAQAAHYELQTTPCATNRTEHGVGL
jgi:hypothetical protein